MDPIPSNWHEMDILDKLKHADRQIRLALPGGRHNPGTFAALLPEAADEIERLRWEAR